MTFVEIWKTLSSLDLSDVIEEKMKLKYISWANAWEVVMNHYPTATYSIKEPTSFNDGSMEVWVEVDIHGHKRDMWLPVMDHRNKAIINPSARDVSDARMRCVVKCLAMFGLGLYLYQGEDLPRAEKESRKQDHLMGAIQTLMQQNSLQTLTSEFKRLTHGHDPQSEFYQKLKTAAANRKGEIENESTA